MFVVWFLLGLIFCGPVGILASAALPYALGVEPVVGWFIMAAVAVIVAGGVAIFSKWSRDRKESWFGVLFGAVMGGGFIWCFLYTHPK